MLLWSTGDRSAAHQPTHRPPALACSFENEEKFPYNDGVMLWNMAHMRATNEAFVAWILGHTNGMYFPGTLPAAGARAREAWFGRLAWRAAAAVRRPWQACKGHAPERAPACTAVRCACSTRLQHHHLRLLRLLRLLLSSTPLPPLLASSARLRPYGPGCLQPVL